MRTKTKGLGLRLTDDADHLLKLLSASRGYSKTSVIEALVREEAKRIKITLPAQEITTDDKPV